ncbi:hypothetical protein PVL29_023533 [Vitis rotundifolia]|uniref:Uncharacterized protein n=1 Tax=Vitis rotundifolia TaxID=103349 RepID=A0AA38YP87_VITRO|nr:hypothetical protein PVL29_023533 [Vitis rotundifolia]
MSKKEEEPVMGIPYPAVYHPNQNPYKAGVIPPNAFVGDPKGVPIQQTIFRDTPAPFFTLVTPELPQYFSFFYYYFSLSFSGHFIYIGICKPT